MNAVLEEKQPLLQEEYEEADFEEVKRLSAELIEKHKRAFIALANAESIDEGKKYIKLMYDDMKAVSDELIEKNKEVYIALANS